MPTHPMVDTAYTHRPMPESTVRDAAKAARKLDATATIRRAIALSVIARDGNYESWREVADVLLDAIAKVGAI